MSQPIVLTNGQHEIKIYTVQNSGRAVFQLSFHEGGHRQRQTFGKLSDARREAKVVLGRLEVNTRVFCFGSLKHKERRGCGGAQGR